MNFYNVHLYSAIFEGLVCQNNQSCDHFYFFFEKWEKKKISRKMFPCRYAQCSRKVSSRKLYIKIWSFAIASGVCLTFKHITWFWKKVDKNKGQVYFLWTPMGRMIDAKSLTYLPHFLSPIFFSLDQHHRVKVIVNIEKWLPQLILSKGFYSITFPLYLFHIMIYFLWGFLT